MNKYVKKLGHIKAVVRFKSKRRYLDRLVDGVILVIALLFCLSLFWPIIQGLAIAIQ